jgi:YfiH family protein
VATDLKEIDGLFKAAGLVRSLKGKAGARPKAGRFEEAAAEELIRRGETPRVAANGVEWLAAPGCQKVPWLWHGFSTRRGGVSRPYCAEDATGELNLGFTADDSKEAVAQNRLLLAEAVTGYGKTPLIALRQFHSNLVHGATAAEALRERSWRADGLITSESGFLLGIQTADCIPVLVADKKRRVVGAFHAGWRGTVKRIVELAVGRMRLEFGSRPEDLIAAIGPGVGACCYAVGEEVLSEFESQFQYARAVSRGLLDGRGADKVPDAFPDPACPWSLTDWTRTASGSGGGEPAAVAGSRFESERHPCRRRMHELPARAVLFAPRLEGTCRKDDGSNWDQAALSGGPL